MIKWMRGGQYASDNDMDGVLVRRLPGKGNVVYGYAVWRDALQMEIGSDVTPFEL